MSELRLFHAADLHLDSGFEYLPPEAANIRREGQRELMERIARTAQDMGAQALVLSGDVFESDSVSAETRRVFCRALGGLDMPVFVAPGNHDPYTTSSVWARMELPENVKVFRGEEITCLEYPELNARFWGAGFINTFCPPLLRDFAPPEKIEGIFDVMALHGDLSAGITDYCPITRAELEVCGMDYVALGHIHSGSPLQMAGRTAFAYPGCAEGRGYDELGAKGGLFVTLSPEGVRAQFVPLGAVRYEIFELNLSDSNIPEAINQLTIELTDKDYCRIILKGEIEAALDLPVLRKSLEGRFAELQLRDETVLKRDTWAQMGQDSLTGLFLQKLKTLLDGAEDERQRQKIELAANYGLTALENGGGRL